MIKIYDISGVLNFLYLPKITQYNFSILTLLVIENITVLLSHSFHIR